MRRWFVLLALLGAIGGAWLALSGGPEADAAEPQAESADAEPSTPAAEVRVEEVIGQSLGARLWIPGTVVSRHDAEIAAEVPGPLAEVAEVGALVRRGDVLARVDDEALRLRLRADEAEIRRLEAQVDYLDRQLERIDTLSREQIAARTQLDELASQRAMAEQALESARVERDTTAFQIERSMLRAPFPGRVVARLAPPGSYLGVGDAVVRLVDTGHVEVRARAPLASANRVRDGMVLELEGPAGSSSGACVVCGGSRGRVRAAVPVGDERSRTFELRIVPDVAEGRSAWPVGLPVRVALPNGATSSQGSLSQGPSSTVSVPRDALVLRRDATYVFVVTPDDTARRVEVVPGAGDGQRIEVEGELRHGDRVVVRGAERLDDGVPVRVVG